eukprot:TRINITY_DN3104_c1_g1_i1.p1 TRINITY_DN3104_c1_g1~~TRINITY_DN3104_c1_g1_i1.p1  ORF type:complete len:1434 (+),score=144.12 TRINITY_DN3104_c1_g1_i1:11448-15749(+)
MKTFNYYYLSKSSSLSVLLYRSLLFNNNNCYYYQDSTMLNGYALDKKLDKHYSTLRTNEKLLEQRTHREKMRRKLANNYRLRIEKFISTVLLRQILLQMTSDPVPQNANNLAESLFYPKASSGFVITGWKSERERIQVFKAKSQQQDAIEKHKFFTSEPSLINERDFPKLLRARLPEKEINPDMRFTAKNDIERVLDSVKANQAYVDASELTTLKSYDSEFLVSRKSKDRKHEVAKKVRPKLHKKTHFQAVMALVNRQSKVLAKCFDTVKAGNDKDTEMTTEGRQEVINKGNSPVLIGGRSSSVPMLPKLAINNQSPLKDWKYGFKGKGDFPVETNSPVLSPSSISLKKKPKAKRKVTFTLPFSVTQSQLLTNPEVSQELNEGEELGKRVLSQCGMIRSKSPKTFETSLKKGGGHLMSGFGMSNKEVYFRVFHNNKDQSIPALIILILIYHLQHKSRLCAAQVQKYIGKHKMKPEIFQRSKRLGTNSVKALKSKTITNMAPVESLATEPADPLFSMKMISVDALSLDHVLALNSQNASLKSFQNKIHYEVQEKIRQKHALEEQLRSLQRATADYESKFSEQRLSFLEKQCVNISDSICFAEIERRAFEHMYAKEKKNKLFLGKSIEDIKKQLKKADELVIDAIEVEKGADQRKLEEEEKTDCKTDIKIAKELKAKILQGKKTQETLIKETEESKKRVQEAEDAIKLVKLRNERHKEKTRKIKRQIGEYTGLITRLRIYREAFVQQYNMIKAAYNTTHRGEIMSKKDTYDIQLQSERNLCKDKISVLKRHEQTLYSLQAVLAALKEEKDKKNNNKIATLKVLDAGEYNKNAVATKYVDSKDELMQVNVALEEKLAFLRKAISGIKHILFTLQTYDKYEETGTWHDLNVVDALEDISTAETLPKFSRLLLVLEQKIVAVAFLTSQNIKHLDLTKNTLVGSEDPDYEAPILLNVNNTTNCRDILKKFLDSRDPLAATSLESPGEHPLTEPKIDDDNLGRYILETDVVKRPQGIGLHKVGETLSPIGNTKVDLVDLGEQAFDICRRKNKRIIFNNQTIRVEPAIEDINEQLLLSERFSKGRLKVKIENEIALRERKSTIPTEKIIKKPTQKKRLTNLTLEVTRAMKNRPPEVVEAARETFVTLDKIRGLDDEKFHRELEENQKYFPNFLGAILSMKKSRNDEKIGRIASKCTYFVDKPLSACPSLRPLQKNGRNKTQLQNFISEIPTAEEFVMGSMQKRIKNLKSLDRLDQWLTSSTNAFEAFCTREKECVSIKADTQKRPGTQQQKKGWIPKTKLNSNFMSMKAFTPAASRLDGMINPISLFKHKQHFIGIITKQQHNMRVQSLKIAIIFCNTKRQIKQWSYTRFCQSLLRSGASLSTRSYVRLLTPQLQAKVFPLAFQIIPPSFLAKPSHLPLWENCGKTRFQSSNPLIKRLWQY